MLDQLNVTLCKNIVSLSLQCSVSPKITFVHLVFAVPHKTNTFFNLVLICY